VAVPTVRPLLFIVLSETSIDAEQRILHKPHLLTLLTHTGQVQQYLSVSIVSAADTGRDWLK